jgi:hypothetical protein
MYRARVAWQEMWKRGGGKATAAQPPSALSPHLLSQKFLIACWKEHHVENMTATRKFQPSSIKNKIKREDEARKLKRSKRQDKLQRRLALAKAEANDPAAKKVSTLTVSFPIMTEQSIVGASS